jgi:hypothetical protein
MFILVKFPSRGRPEKLLHTLNLYIEKADDISLMCFMITLDSDDPNVTPELIGRILAMGSNIRVTQGFSGSKIAAINRDLESAPPFDILLLASDDMIPIVQGYDNIIRSTMRTYYPSTDGVLWFNDGFQGRRLNTLCILGRTYFQRFGYIYHPEYKSFWCDNEFTQVASRLNRQTYIDKVIIRHEHPGNGVGMLDETHLRNSVSNNGADTILYNRRRKLGFGLHILSFLKH